VQALCNPKAIHCIKLIDRYRGDRSGMHSAEVMITSHKMPSLTDPLATLTRTTFSNDNLHSLPTSRFDQSAPSTVKRASLAKTQGLLKLDLRTHVWTFSSHKTTIVEHLVCTHSRFMQEVFVVQMPQAEDYPRKVGDSGRTSTSALQNAL